MKHRASALGSSSDSRGTMRSVQPCPIGRHACVQMLQRRDASSLEISFFIGFHRSRVGRAGATGGGCLACEPGHRGASARRPSSRTKESEKRHDQDIGVRVGSGGLLARAVHGLGPAGDPRRLDHPGGGSQVLDHAAPDSFPQLGKTYKIEWSSSRAPRRWCRPWSQARSTARRRAAVAREGVIEATPGLHHRPARRRAPAASRFTGP